LFSGGFKTSLEFEEFYKIMAPLYVYKHQQQDAVPTTKSKIPYNVDVTNLGFGNFLIRFMGSGVLQKSSNSLRIRA